MNNILLTIILVFTSFITIIMCGAFLEDLNEHNIIKRLVVYSCILLINISGWYWLCSGSCHFDGTEYAQIKRDNNIKYFTYDGDIVKIDDRVDMTEYSIKIDKYSSQYQNGIYYSASDKGTRYNWSYIKTSEIPKTK